MDFGEDLIEPRALPAVPESLIPLQVDEAAAVGREQCWRLGHPARAVLAAVGKPEVLQQLRPRRRAGLRTKNCTNSARGWAEIVGQVQSSTRDSQSRQ